MQTYSRLTLLSFLLIITVTPEDTDGSPINGRHVTYHKNGKIQTECFYIKGRAHGVLTTWYENGNKEMMASFNNGVAHGSTIMWYKNGNKKSEQVFNLSLIDGLSTTWYVNGKMATRINFKLGQKHGLETQWDKDGNRTVTIKYDNDREISRILGPDEPGQQETIPDQKQIRPAQKKSLPEGDIQPPSAQHRVFKDITLKYRMPARCVGVENGVAVLKDKNDKIKRVPIEKLSKRDQKWLRENFPESESESE